MIYEFKNENNPKDFRDCLNPKELFFGSKGGSTYLKKVPENQGKFKSDLIETNREKGKYKSEKQKSVINNANRFYQAREKVIEIFRKYSYWLYEAQYTAKHVK